MASTVFAGDTVELFVAAGWRQFTLNEQFVVSAPCTSLAELCSLSPKKLEGSPFTNLFIPADKEQLRLRLAQLTTTSPQPVSSMIVVLQVTDQTQMPVEIMLYPTPEKVAQSSYVGFIRPIPKSLTNFFEEKVSRQHGFKHKHVERIAQLGRHIAAILDLDTLLDYVVKSLSQDFGYSYTSIFLVDDNETTITLQAISGMPSDTAHHVSLVIDSQTIIGHVAVTARPIQTPHARQPHYHQPNFFPIKAQAELAIPIVSGRQVLGVLDVQSETHHAFQTDDLVLLQTIANQLAVAIANARLLEERDRRMLELSTFNQIGVALVGHQDLESTLSNILRRVSALFQVEAVTLMLLEEDGLHFAVAIGGAADDIKSFVLKPGQGIAWSVVESRQTIRVDDVKSDSRHFSDIDTAVNFTTNSLLAVPVQIHDRVLGVIEVMNRQDGLAFTRNNEATLEFIASAVAVVLENARLFDETQQQLNALATLTQASEAITKAPDLNRLLEIVLEFALGIIGTNAGAIALTDDLLPQTLRVVVARGYKLPVIEQFNRLNILYDVGVFGKAFRGRELVAVPDSTADPQLVTSAQLDGVLPKPFTTVPLFSQDDFVGIIILHALPDDSSRAMLKAVADIAAVAIDKARLFGKTNQWLAEVLTLYTLADQLTKVLDLDLNHIIESSVGILKHALDCSSCCLFLKAEADQAEALELRACSGRSEGDQRRPEMEYIAALAADLVREPRSLYLEDIAELQQAESAGRTLPKPPPLLTRGKTTPAELQIRSVMMVPLVVKEKVLGALSIDHKKPKAFSQSEDRLLTIAAAQISTAIENIRLYNDLEQHAAELELALGELREVNRLKSEFVQNVSHELRTPLTFVVAYVELIREGSLGHVPPEVQDKLTIISEKTRAITRLVEDVISLQKIEAGNLRFEVVTPQQLVSSATSGATASAAEHDITIVTSSSPDLPAVRVDVDRIGQVFDNLIGNAIKFSLDGGEISINASQEHDFVKFSVRDSGIGIPADKLARVFERFYQVDGSVTRRYGGTGLGLAIVKQIVEAHGGRVTVASELNKNTTFSFFLPIHQGETTA